MVREKNLKMLPLMGALQGFLKSREEEELFLHFAKLALPHLDTWASDSSLSLEEWPTLKWLTRNLYDEPPGTVASHRAQAKELQSLKANLLSEGKQFLGSNLKRKPFLSRAKQWVLSQEYDRDFAEVFKHQRSNNNDLFALCYLAAIAEIERLLKSADTISCLTCGLPMIREGKRAFCSVNCRTIFNNKKRDPKKHNLAEKQNRKQRIIKKNAQDRKRQ